MGLDPMENVVAAINAGGDEYTSSEGVIFEPDVYYLGGTAQAKSNCDVADTYDDGLYQTHRTSTVHYVSVRPRTQVQGGSSLQRTALSIPNPFRSPIWPTSIRSECTSA